jgi:hypothetical protein
MRIQTDQKFDAFLSKWRAALRAKGDCWEGTWAVGELERAGYPIDFEDPHPGRSSLTFVRCDSAQCWRPNEMLGRILAEVIDYKRMRAVWQDELREFSAVELFLAGIERRVIDKRIQSHSPRLKELLKKTADEIEVKRKTVKQLQNAKHYSPLGVWERLWEKNVRSEIVSRETDLDTRLQLQVAKMFRTFLHESEGVSRRTIARLVVLVFQIAGIASEFNNEGFLRIVDSKRSLTVRSVEEKLSRNRIR